MWYSIIRGDFSKKKNILHNLFSTFEILILILHSLVEKSSRPKIVFDIIISHFIKSKLLHFINNVIFC